jgi:hypothetical protein
VERDKWERRAEAWRLNPRETADFEFFDRTGILLANVEAI